MLTILYEQRREVLNEKVIASHKGFQFTIENVDAKGELVFPDMNICVSNGKKWTAKFWNAKSVNETLETLVVGKPKASNTEKKDIPLAKIGQEEVPTVLM